MHVSEVMTEGVVTVGIDTPVRRAQELMRAHDLTFLPVVHEATCAGVLTAEDIETKVRAAGLDPDTARVGEVMSPGVGEASPHDLGANEGIAAISRRATVEEAARRMEAFNVRRLAVHDTDYHIVGIVSQSDLKRGRRETDPRDSK